MVFSMPEYSSGRFIVRSIPTWQLSSSSVPQASIFWSFFVTMVPSANEVVPWSPWRVVMLFFMAFGDYVGRF